MTIHFFFISLKPLCNTIFCVLILICFIVLLAFIYRIIDFTIKAVFFNISLITKRLGLLKLQSKSHTYYSIKRNALTLNITTLMAECLITYCIFLLNWTFDCYIFIAFINFVTTTSLFLYYSAKLGCVTFTIKIHGYVWKKCFDF